MRQTVKHQGRSGLGHQGNIIAEVSVIGKCCLGYTPPAAAQTCRALARAF